MKLLREIVDSRSRKRGKEMHNMNLDHLKYQRESYCQSPWELSLVDSGTNIKKATTGQRLENLSINKDNDCHELKHMTYVLFSLSLCKASQKKKITRKPKTFICFGGH